MTDEGRSTRTVRIRIPAVPCRRRVVAHVNTLMWRRNLVVFISRSCYRHDYRKRASGGRTSSNERKRTMSLPSKLLRIRWGGLAAVTALAVILSPSFITGVVGSSAHAADIYDQAPRRGSAYDDPRYADIYGDSDARRYDAPRYDVPRREPYARYAERHEPDHPRVYRDDYLAPMPGVRRFDRHDDHPNRSACISRDEAKDRLVESGWRNFHDVDLRPEIVLITARRSNGQVYRLKIDRCSGEILNARALDGHSDTYATRRPGREYY
jgi:hypothetical protein